MSDPPRSHVPRVSPADELPGSGDEAVRWIIEGRVQGVGFRYFATRVAIRLHVRGWVRNLDDGTVEVVASASSEVLHTFRAHLREGPRHGRVTRVTETEADAPALPDRFEVRY